MKQELQRSFQDTVGALLADYYASAGDIGDRMVAHVNKAREIGITLKEWSGAEQISMGFYQRQVEAGALPKELSFDRAKQFISIANKLPEPAKSMDEARKVMQLDFVTSGLVQIPERSSGGKASETTPMVGFVNALGGAKERLQKWQDVDPIEKWTATRKQSVAGELRPFVELYQRLMGI